MKDGNDHFQVILHHSGNSNSNRLYDLPLHTRHNVNQSHVTWYNFLCNIPFGTLLGKLNHIVLGVGALNVKHPLGEGNNIVIFKGLSHW